MITQQRLKELLSYDPDTGLFTWLVYRGRCARKGQIAGSIDDGYVKIIIDRNTYRAHRLAFLYVKGVIPTQEVDHINRIRSDNRWSNLREASKSQNMRNKGVHKNNLSGVKGVNYRKESGKYRVLIKVKGKIISFGQYDDVELAELVASEVRAKYDGEFSSRYPD